jgi:hypothetical protein
LVSAHGGLVALTARVSARYSMPMQQLLRDYRNVGNCTHDAKKSHSDKQ